MSSSPEKINFGPEQKHDPEALTREAMERHDQLRRHHEQAGEKTRENLDDARHEALERAKSVEHQEDKVRHERVASPAERRNNTPIGDTERDASFNATM